MVAGSTTFAQTASVEAILGPATAKDAFDGTSTVGARGYISQVQLATTPLVPGYALATGVGPGLGVLSAQSGMSGGWWRLSFDGDFGGELVTGTEQLLSSALTVPNVIPDPDSHVAGFRDAIWRNSTRVLTEGAGYTSPTGNPAGFWTWRSFSRVGTLASGERYFFGSLAQVGINPSFPDGPATLEGIFKGEPPVAVLLGGATPSGLSHPIHNFGGIAPSFAISGAGVHYVAEVRLMNSNQDRVLVSDGTGLMIGGVLAKLGTDAMFVGHNADEQWLRFRSLGITDDGRVMVAATTQTEMLGQVFEQDVLVFDGTLVARTGGVFATETLGSIVSAACNSTGDVSHSWINEDGEWVLLFNDRRVIGKNEMIEFAPPVPPPFGPNDSALVHPLNAGRIRCSERDGDMVNIYFSARIYHYSTSTEKDYLVRAQVSTNVCQADIDENGTLDIDDFITFQTLYALGDPRADIDGNGVFDIDDYIAFQTIYALGC